MIYICICVCKSFYRVLQITGSTPTCYYSAGSSHWSTLFYYHLKVDSTSLRPFHA